MPKSKRGKGKQAHYNKARQTPVNTSGAPQATAVNTAAPAVNKIAAAPKITKSGAVAISAAEERSNVVSELKRIGIWFGVIIVALIVLVLVIK